MEKDLKKRAVWLYGELKKTYPDAHCELDHGSPLELMVATILSAQCTDKRVNLVTKELFRKYRTVSDYAKASLKELEQDIRSTGFYKNKALNIQRACRDIVEKHRGQVPETMDELTCLPGIGRKTANVILGTAFGKTEGIVVDTHVIRISGLLGLTKEKDAVKIEQDLMRLFPRKNWDLLSHLITWHGRRCCVARRPECARCPLRPQCPYGLKRKL